MVQYERLSQQNLGNFLKSFDIISTKITNICVIYSFRLFFCLFVQVPCYNSADKQYHNR